MLQSGDAVFVSQLREAAVDPTDLLEAERFERLAEQAELGREGRGALRLVAPVAA